MWEIIVQIVIAMAVSYGLSYAFKKTASQMKPEGKEGFDLPTAEEDRPYPVVWGCRRVQSPNAISPILEFHAKKKKRHDQVVAYYYYVTLQLGVCQSHIDGIKQIWVADTCLWPTLEDSDDLAADGLEEAYIDEFECWGGWSRNGGIRGYVNIHYGQDTQTPDTYLASLGYTPAVAYRGITTVVLRNVYIGAQVYLKPWSFLCKRTNQLSDGSAMWYIAKAPVGSDGDLNAIHILYELLTSTVIGLGKDASLIGDSFTTAADTCYDEGFGLSCVWDWDKDDIEDMVRQIEEIIDGKVYIDPQTGKFEIALVRDSDPVWVGGEGGAG
jgi:hypothetical protein